MIPHKYANISAFVIFTFNAEIYKDLVIFIW